mgnify:CR=1 FL=1
MVPGLKGQLSAIAAGTAASAIAGDAAVRIKAGGVVVTSDAGRTGPCVPAPLPLHWLSVLASMMSSGQVNIVDETWRPT